MTLAHWHRLSDVDAAKAILPCCGSAEWAAAMAAQRPYPSLKAFLTAATTLWRALPQTAWQQAFDSHPRIGQHHAQQATAESLRWSAQEQQTALIPASDQAEAATQALAAANRRYEEKFGRIFIVCACGKSTTEILKTLEARMANDPTTELYEAAEQQRQITQLRLRRWLEGN